MPVQYKCGVPKSDGQILDLIWEPGQSIVIIGANGSGKTRLGVYIEGQVPAVAVQRIAAQKSLTMRDDLEIVSSERANKLLRYGYAEGHEGHKPGHRWGTKPATHFLSDFDALLQTLFSKHNLIASRHLQERKQTPDIPAPTTELERLKLIWEGLLPHRALEILDASVKVKGIQPNMADSYPGSEMSDGERAIFYFLGQCLVAPNDAVLIIDEPEAHIHKAILPALWDAIEKARPDASFIYITHDLEFAVSHNASAKYYLRSYSRQPERWEIAEVPEDTGLPEQVVAELMGSRKPILFVEGDRGSLDLTIYRSQYSGFTIIPIGSCEAVIHSVASFKKSAALHWLGARGLVDSDHRDASDVAYLNSRDVSALPVAEVENLLLLPSVFLALAEALLCADPAQLLAKLTVEIMKRATANVELVSARYATRRIDRLLKRVEVDSSNLLTLRSSFSAQLAAIDPVAIFTDFKSSLNRSIQDANLPDVLRLYDDKRLLDPAAYFLGLRDRKQLLEKVGRLLGEDKGEKLREELTRVLPVLI